MNDFDDAPAPITPEIKDAVAWMCAVHELERQGDWVEEGDLAAVERRFDESMDLLTDNERDTVKDIYWGNYVPPCAVSNFRVQNGLWGEDQYWSSEVEEAMGRKAYTLLKGSP